MSNKSNANIKIDSEHSRAICDEIGYRLRLTLQHEATNPPPFLQSLVARLSTTAPSIAPCLEDMVFDVPSPSAAQDESLACADFAYQVAS